jgi:hypothetical protein
MALLTAVGANHPINQHWQLSLPLLHTQLARDGEQFLFIINISST